jgi:hypothetical protein
MIDLTEDFDCEDCDLLYLCLLEDHKECIKKVEE